MLNPTLTLSTTQQKAFLNQVLKFNNIIKNQDPEEMLRFMNTHEMKTNMILSQKYFPNLYFPINNTFICNYTQNILKQPNRIIFPGTMQANFQTLNDIYMLNRFGLLLDKLHNEYNIPTNYDLLENKFQLHPAFGEKHLQMYPQ
jgi:hypothetical protein